MPARRRVRVAGGSRIQQDDACPFSFPLSDAEGRVCAAVRFTKSIVKARFLRSPTIMRLSVRGGSTTRPWLGRVCRTDWPIRNKNCDFIVEQVFNLSVGRKREDRELNLGNTGRLEISPYNGEALIITPTIAVMDRDGPPGPNTSPTRELARQAQISRLSSSKRNLRISEL